MKIVPSEIRRIRGEMTQEKFAAAWGINLKTYRNWEAGTTEPNNGAENWLRVIDAAPDLAASIIRGRRAKTPKPEPLPTPAQEVALIARDLLTAQRALSALAKELA